MGSRIVGLVVAIALFGCGEDEGTTAGEWQAFCQEKCNWKLRCNNAKPTCLSDCTSDGQGVLVNYKGAFFRSLADCFKNLSACGSDDVCFTQAVQSIEPNVTSNPDFTKCMSVRDSCDKAGTSFSDDYCPMFPALVDSARDKALACFNLPCEQIKGCLDLIFGD